MNAKHPLSRWLTLLALIVLLMPLVAACGAEAPNTNAPVGNEPTVGTQVDTPPTLAPAGTEPATGGATAPTEGDTETPAGGTDGEATAAATVTGTAEGGDTGAGTGAPREGTAGGTAVVGIVQEPDILDPFVTGMTFAVWILHTTDVPMIRAGLDGELQPMLLTEVPTVDNGGISEDGLTYTVNFKEGLKWSDGKPLTAQDLVFTWKTVLTPEYGAASTLGWEQIEDIKLSNNNLTATITLKEAYAPFLAAVLAGTGDVSAGFLLPAHKFEGMQPGQYTKSDYGLVGSSGHVGNGPFKLEEWRKGDQIRVVRNEHYAGEPALLDSIVFSVLENSDQQTTQLQNGDIDMATNYTEGDIPTLEQLADQGITLIANPAVGSIERFIFNLKDPKDPNTKTNPTQAKDHPIFGDKNVRMAIAMGMNRPAIVESLLYNKTKPGITELDNTQWLNEELQPYPYDPEQAKQLLDEAGWKPGPDGIREKNGQRLSFTHVTTSGNPLRERVQRGVINDLKNIGVEMKIANVKADKLFASYSQGGVAATGAYDMVGYTTGISPLDPDLTPFYATDQIPSQANNGVGSNNGRYSNPELDKLLEQQATEVDPEARQKLLDQIQTIVYNDVAVIYMYDRLRIDAAGPNLKGYQADPTAGLWWNPEDWYLQEQQ